MYPTHRLTPDLEAALVGVHWATIDRIKRVFADYESLLKTAERDREVVLGFVDALGFRFDDLPADPKAARARAGHMANTALMEVREDTITSCARVAGDNATVVAAIQTLSKPTL
jgi:hypothetical protein